MESLSFLLGEDLFSNDEFIKNKTKQNQQKTFFFVTFHFGLTSPTLVAHIFGDDFGERFGEKEGEEERVCKI